MGQEKHRAGLPLKWGVMILFAGVPFLVAALMLQLLGPPGAPLSSAELERLHVAASPEILFAGRDDYAALVTIHVFACIAAIVFARLVLRSVPRGAALEPVGLALGFGIAGLLLSLLAGTFGRSIFAYQLTYFNYEDLFRERLRRLAARLAIGLRRSVWPPICRARSACRGRVDRRRGGRAAQLHRRSRRWPRGGAGGRALPCRGRHQTAHLRAVPGPGDEHRRRIPILPAPGEAGRCRRQPRRSRPARGLWRRADLVLGRHLHAYAACRRRHPLLLVQQQVRGFLEGLHPPTRADPFRERMARAGALSGGGEQMKVLFAFTRRSPRRRSPASFRRRWAEPQEL